MKRPCLSLVVLLAARLAAAENAPPAPSAPPLVVTPDFITRLADEMRTNHPALKAAAHRARAARSGAAAVRTWEDPMVVLGGMGADDEMRAQEGDLIYGVEQRLPIGGKPQAARRAAQARIAVSEADENNQFQTRRRDLAQALMKAAAADEIVALDAEDLRWLGTLEASAEARYRLGDTPLAQLLRIQNDRARRAEQLTTDRQRRIESIATVNRLLGRELQSPWPMLRLPPPAGPVAYTPRLAALAADYDPRASTQRAMVREAEAGLEVARRSRFPDISLGAEARNYSGDGEFRQAMLTLRFGLPWVNAGRYRSDIAREAALVEAAQNDASDLTRAIGEEVFRLTIDIDAARREALLYRDNVIPRSEKAVESAHAAWLANRGPFWDVLEARRMLIEAQSMYVRAVAEQYQALTELVLCCGLGDLESLSMIGAQPDANDGRIRPSASPTLAPQSQPLSK